jgi:hypothetical protein
VTFVQQTRSDPAIAALLLIALLQSPPPTQLTIQAVDRVGRPVSLAKVELYVDYWGGGETVPLPHRGHLVDVPLGRAWFCQMKPRWCEPGFAPESVRIILRADGYAPMASEPLNLLRRSEEASRFGKPADDAIKVRFPRHAGIAIADGRQVTVRLTLRPAGTRVVRIVDQQGRPVSGARVEAEEFMAQTNHCGVAEPGEEPLLDAIETGADGRVVVPDLDMEYAFLITKPHYMLVDREDGDPDATILRLTAPETMIRMNRLVRRPLRLEFREGGRPAAGLAVWGMTRRCGCGGGCSGPLGTTDANGHIAIDDFFPGEWEWIFLLGRENRPWRWQIDPAKLSGGRWTVVVLDQPRVEAPATIPSSR